MLLLATMNVDRTRIRRTRVAKRVTHASWGRAPPPLIGVSQMLTGEEASSEPVIYHQGSTAGGRLCMIDGSQSQRATPFSRELQLARTRTKQMKNPVVPPKYASKLCEISRSPRYYMALQIDRTTPRAMPIIYAYSWERVQEFRALASIRRKASRLCYSFCLDRALTGFVQGWDTRDGYEFFSLQRQKADQSTTKTARFFYSMMKNIAQDLYLATKVFDVLSLSSENPKVLDLCMAPGGFLETALEHDTRSQITAFSLPAAQGGHQILMPRPQGRSEVLERYNACSRYGRNKHS